MTVIHLRNTESTISSISFLHLNIRSKNIFGNILAAAYVDVFIDFIVLCLFIAFFFSVLYVCLLCSGAVLLLWRDK